MTRPPKRSIWYISKYLLTPESNGVGSRGFFLAEQFVKKGYETTVFCSDANHLGRTPNVPGYFLLEENKQVKIYWIKTSKYTKAKSLGRIISWINFEIKLFFLQKKDIPKPEAIIISSLSLLSIINGIWFKFRYKARLIFEIRDIWPLTLTEEGNYSTYNPFIIILSIIEKIGYQYSDAIVGTMPNLKQHTQSVTNQDLEVHCIPMGIDQYLISKTQTLDPNFINLHLPKDKFIVAYAGTIGATNALETYFSSIKSMEKNKDIHFVCIGDGDLREEFIHKYGNLDNLSFIPKLSREDLIDFLGYCDVLYFSVFPSKVWKFGQSLNKLIDYMLAARPIVASYGGYQSMINEAKCGKFLPIDDNDSLIKAFIDYSNMEKKKLNEIGKNGRNWLLTNRPYDILADHYLEILFPN